MGVVVVQVVVVLVVVLIVVVVVLVVLVVLVLAVATQRWRDTTGNASIAPLLKIQGGWRSEVRGQRAHVTGEAASCHQHR